MIDLPFFDARHRRLRDSLADLAPSLDAIAAQGEAGAVDAAGRDAIRLAADARLFHPFIPAAFGGEGPDLRAVCLVREALAYRSGLADAVYAVQGLGSYPIALAQTEPLASRILPEIVAGRGIAAFALTEPGAGSDASALATRAVRDGDTYVIDGAKTFTSNAPIATVFTVFARTADGPRRHISAFVIEAGTPGLVVSRRQELAAPHPIGELRLAGCRVPARQRLGEEGDGMRLALGTLDFFRTSVAAAACGMAARALDESLARVQSRTQFGQHLSEFQLTQAALADMRTELDAARLLVCRAAWARDAGAARVTHDAAVAKLFATEAAQRIVDRAVQLHGGTGVERGSVVERLYREVRAPRIYEGTSEIQRLVIARELLESRNR